MNAGWVLASLSAYNCLVVFSGTSLFSASYFASCSFWLSHGIRCLTFHLHEMRLRNAVSPAFHELESILIVAANVLQLDNANIVCSKLLLGPER